MARPRRGPFVRKLGDRPYRKMILISSEGSITEPAYFDLFTPFFPLLRVLTKHGRGKGGSDPAAVLKRMEEALRREPLRPNDEAWLLVDKDKWSDDQLRPLADWAAGQKQRHLAVSNPCFEYWLLLHFEEPPATGCHTAVACGDRLKKHLKNYDKDIHPRKFTRESIRSALARASKRTASMRGAWPEFYGTTVHRLVENILEAVDSADGHAQ